jgi:hypothetical protein
MTALFLSIVSILVVVVNFVLSILDRGKRSQKENHQELIEYQLEELKADVKSILNKLERYDKEFDNRINKAIELHVQLYHKGGNKV